MRIATTWNRFLRSVWFFPAALLIPLILLTGLGISGSSVGIYHEVFYSDAVDDPQLLFGEPRSVRSDEWLVNTQATIAQRNNDFQAFNANIGKCSAHHYFMVAASRAERIKLGLWNIII